MPVKTDRNDARGIAQLMRPGWLRSVHCKSLPAQETRALLTARKLLQTKNHDVEMSLRGVLRGFGLKELASNAVMSMGSGIVAYRFISTRNFSRRSSPRFRGLGA